MHKELNDNMAVVVKELQINHAIKSQAGWSVTAISTQAAISGGTAQAGGQGLATQSATAVSGNVSDIKDRNKCLSKQHECGIFIDNSVNGKNSNAKPVQELEVYVDKKAYTVFIVRNITTKMFIFVKRQTVTSNMIISIKWS